FHGEENVALTFSLDLGAQIISVVPQPTYRDAGGNLQQSRNTIEVYFNDDELKPSSVENTSFYQLFATQQTADPNDDPVVTPDSVVYDPVANKAVLTFADDLANLGLGAGAFRLRIGNEYQPILTEPFSAGVIGDTLAGAADVGTLGSATLGASLIISSAIEPLPYDLQWPGSIEEPGHRETLPDTLLNETHYAENYLAADDRYGTTTVYYGFPSLYAGLPNLITPEQKDRAREIFELYSTYFGVQFIEDLSGSRGLAIVTGDMRVLNPAVDTGVGGTLCLAQDGLVVLDNAEPWEDSYGGTWFQTAMQGIGLLLGLGYTTDLPPVNTMNANADPFDPDLVEGDPDYYAVTAEDVFPGNNDIIHGQFVYRPDGTDVDIYKFTLDEPGTFSAEVTAERLAEVSLLDSVLTIYDADGNVIARNDDYYSEDSFIELALPAGDYFAAISSTGNVEYDAEVAASGLGGRTQGDYELRLTYRPDRQETGAGTQHMVDIDGTQLDGDADGVPGGVYSFWFNVQSEANTIYVDKTAAGPGTRGSIADPYNNIKAALQAAQPGDIVRIVGNRDHAFDAQIAYDVSVDPTAVAVGDFDGNGTMDIVATNKADDSISILFGLGDGTYRPDVVTGTGDQPGAVGVGDLDNDGDLDILVANQADNTIMLLVNNGTGTFSPGQTWFTGISPSAVALGDVNHDGTLDIFVANRGANQVGVLLSKEDGTHADQVAYNVGQLPNALDLGDVDNDGNLDIVVANQGGNSVSILINQGNGTFVEAAQRPAVGASPSDVAIADLDGDGNRDLVVSNSGDSSMSVLLGLGDGRFHAQVTYAAGSTPSSVAVADIDGDGSPDAVVTNKGSDSVSVFFNNDDETGTFAAAKTYAVGDQPVGLSLADMDGDSRPDIVTANYGSMAGDGDAVSVLLSRRDQSYLIGIDKYGNVLPDGSKMEIPQGVTVMIDAGAVFKLANANIDVGSSSLQLDRSLGALQVLGTPEMNVYFTSYNDKSLGSWQTDQSAADLKPSGAQWGGLVFRNEQDYDEQRTVLENEGIFLNYVNHAEIRYGGGSVSVNGVKSVYNSIHMVEARPTIAFNTVLYAAGAAMSADPNSFADSRFQGDDYTANYDRVGPDIHGNTLLGNTQNGIFVRIATEAGRVLTKLDVCARFDDTDIVHVIAENLIIRGTPGGPTENSDGDLTARLDARLAIDPGIIVKLDGSRIETEMSAQFLAEGTA
ncbi:MAG: VCBS repeat-containing protein, partial [Pirellulales bacterium]|nr:VCBS repeat-containing protein [Pirellulales bacterium]